MPLLRVCLLFSQSTRLTSLRQPRQIKEQLANMNYLVEEWGGKYQSQDISAKKGLGVEELLEKVLLEAEMLELKSQSRPQRNGVDY